MKCMQCKRKITHENKESYKWGLKLPYCKHCTRAYMAARDETAERIKSMSPGERSALRKQLIKQGHKPADIDKGWKEMGIE